MSYALLIPIIGVTWVCIGLVLALVMRRRGHLGFSWFVLGMVMGPMAVVFAIDTLRHEPPEVEVLEPGLPRPGRIDVLVGVDGSPASAAAVDAAARLLRPVLGRLTLATVIDRDESPGSDVEHAAQAELERAAARVRALDPAMELLRHPGFRPELVVLRGRPAEVLSEYAVDRGYEVLVVGSRGAGLAKTVLGSVAEALAAGSAVPALVVPPAATPSGARPAHAAHAVEAS